MRKSEFTKLAKIASAGALVGILLLLICSTVYGLQVAFVASEARFKDNLVQSLTVASSLLFMRDYAVIFTAVSSLSFLSVSVIANKFRSKREAK